MSAAPAHPSSMKKVAASLKLIFGAAQVSQLAELIAQVTYQIQSNDDDTIKGARQAMYDWLKENNNGKIRFATITGASALKALSHLIEFVISNKGHLKESLRGKAGIMLGMDLWEGIMLTLTTLLTNLKDGEGLKAIAEWLDIIPFKTMILGFALSIGPNMLFKTGTGLKELIQHGWAADKEKVLVGALSLLLYGSYLGFIFPTEIATSASTGFGISTVVAAGSLAMKITCKLKSLCCMVAPAPALPGAQSGLPKQPPMPFATSTDAKAERLPATSDSETLEMV